eukprot:505440_1
MDAKANRYETEHHLKAAKQIDELKIVVAIASHIHYDKQISLLQTAVDSLLNQSKKCDVFLSISFGNSTFRNQFESIQMNQISDNINIIISNQQKFQMEHYRILAKLFDRYDLILFCDDDDKYTPDRVFQFGKTYVDGYVALKTNETLAGVIEIPNEKHSIAIRYNVEYWSYGVAPEILNTFFERMNDDNDFDLLKNTSGDLVLREYFFRLDKSKVWIPLNPKSPLYLYTINNPKSVCGSKNNEFAIQKNTYLFAVELGKCPLLRYCTPRVLLQEMEDNFPKLEYAKVVFTFLYDNPEMPCGCGEDFHKKLKQAALNELANLQLLATNFKQHHKLQTAINEIQALPN